MQVAVSCSVCVEIRIVTDQMCWWQSTACLRKRGVWALSMTGRHAMMVCAVMGWVVTCSDVMYCHDVSSSVCRYGMEGLQQACTVADCHQDNPDSAQVSTQDIPPCVSIVSALFDGRSAASLSQQYAGACREPTLCVWFAMRRW